TQTGIVLKGATVLCRIDQFFEVSFFIIWRGLVLVWKAGLKHIICESDCLNGVILIHDVQASSYAADKDIILKIQELLARDWIANVQSIFYDANRVADVLAKDAAQRNLSYLKWFEVTHGIYKLLAEDLPMDIYGSLVVLLLSFLFV
ncbi:hypothetical protein PIB30_057272, partial [Stylosanthes scabra]|nr:hypothetical protein [Stylosanthes scabra]